MNEAQTLLPELNPFYELFSDIAQYTEAAKDVLLACDGLTGITASLNPFSTLSSLTLSARVWSLGSWTSFIRVLQFCSHSNANGINRRTKESYRCCV